MGGVQTLGAGVSRGLKIFGAMGKDAALPSATGFEPEFLKYTMTLQRTQSLPYRFSLRANAMGQYTRDKLLVGEQIVFGASTIGRGFAPAIISGDSGLGGMLELRYDLNPGKVSWLSSPQVGEHPHGSNCCRCVKHSIHSFRRGGITLCAEQKNLG
jgi:hemolysin activation/secretion protein